MTRPNQKETQNIKNSREKKKGGSRRERKDQKERGSCSRRGRRRRRRDEERRARTQKKFDKSHRSLMTSSTCDPLPCCGQIVSLVVQALCLCAWKSPPRYSQALQGTPWHTSLVNLDQTRRLWLNLHHLPLQVRLDKGETKTFGQKYLVKFWSKIFGEASNRWKGND